MTTDYKQARAIDERELFERKFPMPPHCIRCGNGYSATEYNAWDANSYKDKWEGWQARAALAQAQASGKAAPSIDRNAIIEECARVCGEADKSAHPADLADAIRALKDAPKDGAMAAGHQGCGNA